jgi:hypothetical protein
MSLEIKLCALWLRYFFIIKPNRSTNFPNLLRHETLHISGSSSAHQQEFIHCTLGTGICHTGLKITFEQDQDGPFRKLSSNMYDMYQCQVYSDKVLMMGRGTARNM